MAPGVSHVSLSRWREQESCEGDAGPPPPPGNHLHAVLRQPGRRRDLSDRLHLFQLVFGVLPGTADGMMSRLCVGFDMKTAIC